MELEKMGQNILYKRKLGNDIELFKTWFEYKMSPEKNWSNNGIDHVRQVSLIGLSKAKGMRGIFTCKTIQPLRKQNHQHK